MTNDHQGRPYEFQLEETSSREGAVSSEGSFMGSRASTSSSNRSLQIMDTTLTTAARTSADSISLDSVSQDTLEEQASLAGEQRRGRTIKRACMVEWANPGRSSVH
uniref:Uncharacterized protein n=1 Tax=Trichuris muris TaxID=70415 RepID=A0A5S6QXC4_TRIMR